THKWKPVDRTPRAQHWYVTPPPPHPGGVNGPHFAPHGSSWWVVVPVIDPPAMNIAIKTATLTPAIIWVIVRLEPTPVQGIGMTLCTESSDTSPRFAASYSV